MAAFCGYCGSRLDPSDRFCGTCGKPATEAAAGADRATEVVSDQVGRHKSAKPRRGRMGAVQIALFAVLGGGVGVGVGFLATEVVFAEMSEAHTNPSTTQLDTSPTSAVVDERTDTERATTTSSTSGEDEGFGEIVVDGEPLPRFAAGGEDLAVGLRAPTLTGNDGDGTELTIGPDGRAKIVVLLAHWCQHCQAQLPVIDMWLVSGTKPEGVDLYGVIVLTNRLRDETTWPPEEWLAREGWTNPTILDDEEETAAAAFGVTGVPLFVVLDGNNTVLGRVSGELSTQQLADLSLLASEGVASTETTNSTIPGDLGLQKPMARPGCDGSYVTFLGASVNPDRYAEEIAGYLATYPDAEYLRTDVTCSSLRGQTESADAIYAVFFGPFPTFEEACQARARGPSGSYVKPLDNISDPEELPEC